MIKFTAMLPLVLFAALASAQAGDPPWRSAVVSADTNGDGAISMDEVSQYGHQREYLGFQAFMADHFIAFDQDGDGSVSIDELRAGIAGIGMRDDQIENGFRRGFSFMSVQ